MDSQDKILRSIANRECSRVARKVVRTLQGMTQGMQSGDDSGLRNLWDEICVQVQGEESAMWGGYSHTICALIAKNISGLTTELKQAIWLQTDEGADWLFDEGPGDVPYSEDDIAAYMLQDFVLHIAADWSNKRIEKYLESDCEFD